MLGDRLREMRDRKAWSQGHLADAAGLNIRTVQRVEAGESCSYETMLSLAAALGVDVCQLQPENRAGNGVGNRIRPLSSSRTALAALAISPAALFITINVLRSVVGLVGPYDLLASAGARVMSFKTFNAAAPFIFFGGAALAFGICLPALLRLRAKRDGELTTVTGVQLRAQRGPLLLGAAAIACAAILLTYAALEQVRSLTP